jgi:hypothetical protein
MKPDDDSRERDISINPLPVTIIDAGEGRPPMAPSKGKAEPSMNMLPSLFIDASDPKPPTAPPA